MSTLMEKIDELIHDTEVAALPAWTGIPIGRPVFDYHHPDELDAGWARWIAINGRFNCIFLSRMWHRAYTVPHTIVGDHSVDQYDIDLRCAAGAHDQHRATLGLGRICHCVGGTLTQLICRRCAWHHIGTERECVEAWHEHAYPGWRHLPTLPAKLRGKMGAAKMTPKLEEWFDDNYPPQLRVPGAPLLTRRGPYGTRAVLGYSPYGGYDLAAPDNQDEVEPG